METEETWQFDEDLGWDCVKWHMESFGLSREDAQDRDHWRLNIKGELANPGLP